VGNSDLTCSIGAHFETALNTIDELSIQRSLRGACEAAGMMSGIAYLLEAHLVSLIMVGVSIGLMLWRVPTKTAMGNWVFMQVERLKREN